MVVLTENIPVPGASSSSSSSPSSSAHDHKPIYVYDVFLSFRGADTRDGFTDHLYNALLDAGFNAFLDDEEIETSLEPLKPELESAITSSRASIIVLSKNYASSTWCLDELVLILEQKRNFKQKVIPIFYHVEPTDVRKQQNSFGEAMAKYKKTMETVANAEKRSEWGRKIESWKRALTGVSNLKGKDAKGRREVDLIEEIVNDCLRNTMPRLIGMDDHIQLISSWLTDGSYHHGSYPTADILTLVGIGGIGKTFLARHVFRLHFSKFEKSSFIEGINTRCNEHFNGLFDLQKQLFGDISTRHQLQFNDVSVYTSEIEKALAHKRVFIVLDDIGSLDQLDALLGYRGLHPGSKVIITTRDSSLTESCFLFKQGVQFKKKNVSLIGLYEYEALELLCIQAFNSPKPKEGYEDVLEEMVEYCGGHPLALEIFGMTLREQDVSYWEECLRSLKTAPQLDINKVLYTSIESLIIKNYKELFKHIACFFVGIDRDLTETILNACHIKAKYGIMNLIDKCLLHIGCNNELMMHQLVQETGRYLVRQESPEKPWKRSRLWCHEESFNVLKHKKGSGNILGIALDSRKIHIENLLGSLELDTESFSKMDNLMLLQLNYVQLNGCFSNFPEELRWLCMHGSPLKSLPLDLPMENLVALDMSYSNIQSFGPSYSNPQPPSERRKVTGSRSKDKRLLGSLKILDLSFCKQLYSLGEFFELPVLERLIVRNCISLIEVCESIEQCVELILIDMNYCYSLKKLPISLGKLKKVKTLLLDGCNSLEPHVERCDMDSSDISINPQTSSSSIPCDLKFFVFLPCSLRYLSLANNNLSNDSFPMDFSCLPMLEELCLDNNPIVSMPRCVRTLPRLKELSLEDCEMIESIEYPPSTLRVLSVVVNLIRFHRRDCETSLRRVKFDHNMSPLLLKGTECILPPSSLEIDGLVKIQPMVGVGEKVLRCLGWTHLEFLKERRFQAYTLHLEETECLEATECQAQVYYEFGIFSTIYEGGRMPGWVSRKSTGSSISITIPSSPKKLRGLNFYYNMETASHIPYVLPLIKISNATKNHTWIYDHCIEMVKLGGKGCLSWLSHLMFGENEIKDGDHINVVVAQKGEEQVITECGIGLVYDKHEKIYEEGEDVLGYYKSWNHIIGGDLSNLQLTTGEYILNSREFQRCTSKPNGCYLPFINDIAEFKEERGNFKAFPQKECACPPNVVLQHVSPLVSSDWQDTEEDNDFVLGKNVFLKKQKEGLLTLLLFGIGTLFVALLAVIAHFTLARKAV